MADYGHDPTEVAVPYKVFTEAGYEVVFATERGAGGPVPQCDARMLRGWTATLLGATADARRAHDDLLVKSAAYNRPVSWRSIADGSAGAKSGAGAGTGGIGDFDIVFLPGGHEKSVRQLIDAEVVHGLLRAFFPLTGRRRREGEGERQVEDKGEGQAEGEGRKVVAAICHGVQVLAFTADPTSGSPSPIDAGGQLVRGGGGGGGGGEPGENGYRSIIHGCRTTSLTGVLEGAVSVATRPFLGDYYKTYGHATPNVEDYVRHGLDRPDEQFDAGPGVLTGRLGQPFVVEDDHHRYVSGRFPPDAELVARRAVDLVEGRPRVAV